MKASAATSYTPEGEEGQRHGPVICTELAVGQPGASLVCVIHTVLISLTTRGVKETLG